MLKQNSTYCSERESKTFFSWGPPTLFGGLFAVFGVVLFIVEASKPAGFPGFAAFFQSGRGCGPLILVASGVVLGLSLFQRVRFERNYAVISCCTFFPSRIDYADVTGMWSICPDPKYPDSPETIVFQLSSGRKKFWRLNFFSAAAGKAILSELECRVTLPKSARSAPDVQAWADNTLRPSRADRIVLCAAAVAMFSIGFVDMCGRLVWNGRIRSWEKAEGIILKNAVKRVGGGKSPREVADVEYKYTSKGRTYFGTRIVYDSEYFPDLKVGTRRQVIVNPKNPRESAIMFWYRGYWWMLRWVRCAFFYLAAVVLSGIFVRKVSRRGTAVPDALKNYIASFPPEGRRAALNFERSGALLGSVELCQPMEFQQDQRFGIIRQSGSMPGYILFGALFLAAVVISIFIPVCWIVVVWFGIIVYALYVPRMTVFDFEEKKIFFSCRRRFRPEMAGKMKFTSFADVDQLCCFGGYAGNFAALLAVRKDGTTIRICNVRGKRLALLFDLLPELAEKMGHLPITFF